MLNTIIGYPRIGGKRELKFALEKYFKHEIPAEELQNVAATIRKQHYGYFAEQKIDLVPCGDFSFYDNMLDTAVLFNIIPERYVKAGLNALDTYFAMARGVQTSGVDLKALPMKKWFNTNYHYIEPEFDGKNDVKFNPVFLSGLIDEANELKLNYKVAQIGPFTLLKLVKYVAGTSVKDLKDDVVNGYVELLKFCASKNASFVSLAEPSLVKDLTAEDKQLFVEIYTRLLAEKGSLKLGLDTYFGDIRDIYNEVTGLGFDAISLDFKEGRKTFDLIRANGFPKDTVLVAGLINGKNIWRSNYETIIKALDELKSLGINCVLGCSCSLLHVPESTEFETKLSEKVLSYLSFARQKLAELHEIKAIVNGEEGADKFLAANKALFSVKRVEDDAALDAKIASLTDADYTRLPESTERLSIQHKVLGLP